jgi:thiol-disulfide isomerase/thioredoxin
MRRVLIVFAMMAAGLLGLQQARAAEVMKYTPEAFAEAQAAGMPIVVHIAAKWCPTCAAQRPILEKIEQEAAYNNVRVLLVDFDTQKDVVRAMGATMQSTLVVFHGTKEMARTVGDTNAQSIAATVRRSLV